MFKVLKDFKGSPDGFTVEQYVKDQETDLVPALAEVALREKWVKPLPPKPAPKPQPTPAEILAAAIADLEAVIAALEAQHAAAADADRPALAAQLAEKQAALAELKG